MTTSAGRTFLVALAAAILLACGALVPFLGKAFTIDDTVFMRQAERALQDPLHPTSINTVWGDKPNDWVSTSTSGPGMGWLLVPAAVAGGSEVVAHLIQLCGLILAIVSTARLARRLGLPPAWAGGAGLLLSTTPASLGMAGTAMADVWAMALGAIGVDRLVAWKQEGRWHQAVVGALALAYAVLTRSHLLLVVGVGALLVAGDPFTDPGWWRRRPGRWIPVLAAPTFAALVLYVTRAPEERAAGLVGGTQSLMSLGNIPSNLAAFATHWAMAIPLALPWAAVRWRLLLQRWWVWAGGVAAIAGLLGAVPSPYPPYWYVAIPLAGLSVAVLWDILDSAWGRRDVAMLALGAWLLVPLVIAPYVHLPSKYLLASAPAAAILVARELSVGGGSWPRWVLAFTCALGLVLGVAILRADARFSGLGREAAAKGIAPQVAVGRRVWFGGHWGFQWYAERAGARVLTLTPPFPQPGDLIVTSLRSDLTAGIQLLIFETLGASHLGRTEDRTPGGRLMSDGAGFYSNYWGLLPWVWSDGPIDTIDLWQVMPPR